MAFSPPYAPSTNFTDLAAALGIPRDRLDIEFSAIANVVNNVRSNLRRIQRTDGLLLNGVVSLDALSPEVKASVSGGWEPRGPWSAGETYRLKDYVINNGVGYVAVRAHIAGLSFNEDRIAGNWQPGFSLSVLQAKPEVNTFVALGEQSDFSPASPIEANDTILVYKNGVLTSDFSISGNVVSLDFPAVLGDDVLLLHFRVVGDTTVDAIFDARDSALASQDAAALSEAAAAASQGVVAIAESNVLSFKNAAEAARTTAIERAQAAADSAAVALISEGNADNFATDADFSRAAAATSEFETSRRRLPGIYSSIAEAAANPDAQIGVVFATADAEFVLTSISPPEAVQSGAGLSAQQTANLEQIPGIKASTDNSALRLDRFQSRGVSGGANNNYTYSNPAGSEISGYEFGLIVTIIANHANTGAGSCSVDGLPPVAIQKLGGLALIEGDIRLGMAMTLFYDGTAFQLLSAGANKALRAVAALQPAADRLPYFNGPESMALATLTSFARALLDDPSASQMRSTLGLGALATLSAINNGNWSGTDLALTNGGTGASNAAQARLNLGAQAQILFVPGNPGRIEVIDGSNTFALQFGNAVVAGNGTAAQNFSRRFLNVYGAASTHSGTSVSDSDNVNAFPNNLIGMALVNGTGSPKTIYWIAVGRV